MKINDWLKKGEQNFGGKKYFEVAAATYFVHLTNIAIQFNVICHGVCVAYFFSGYRLTKMVSSV